jgi:hypothetical protein
MLKLVTDDNGKRRVVGESEGHLRAADALAKRGTKVATRQQIRAIPAVDAHTVRASERWEHSAHVSNPPVKVTKADGSVRHYRVVRATTNNRGTGKPKSKTNIETRAQVRNRADHALMARMGTIHEQH